MPLTDRSAAQHNTVFIKDNCLSRCHRANRFRKMNRNTILCTLLDLTPCPCMGISDLGCNDLSLFKMIRRHIIDPVCRQPVRKNILRLPDHDLSGVRTEGNSCAAKGFFSRFALAPGGMREFPFLFGLPNACRRKRREKNCRFLPNVP